MHVDESRADMRTGASAYLGLARVLLEEPVTKQAKRLFLAAVVAVVLLLARGLGRRRRRAVLGRGRMRRGLLFDILGAVRQHRDAAPRLLARWHLGLPLAIKARQRGARIARPGSRDCGGRGGTMHTCPGAASGGLGFAATGDSAFLGSVSSPGIVRRGSRSVSRRTLSPPRPNARSSKLRSNLV